MEYFDFFLKVFQKEVLKNNLNAKKVITYNSELNRVDGVFEIPYNRCAYMYKYATCTLGFIKNCITNFLDEYSDLENLLLMWKACSNLKMCSLSCGPGLDYLAFTAALSEFVKLDLQPILKEVTIVSRSAQWKCTLNIIIESIGLLKDFPISTLCEKFSVIQDDFQTFSEKQKAAVQDAHIIFMVKNLNLESLTAFEDKKTYFKELVNTMETNSIIFCIDTKPSVTLMAGVLYQVPGEYIYGPFLNNTFRLPENFPETYKEIYGCLPIISARGAFFVWKKLPVGSCVVNNYPSVLIANDKTKSNGGSTLLIDGINSFGIASSPVNNKKVLPNVFKGFKLDICSMDTEVKAKEDIELLTHLNSELKNVGTNSANSECFINKNYITNEKFIHEASLLNHYYNLNKNSCVPTEQSGNIFTPNQDLDNKITFEMSQKEHINEIEHDVNSLLTDICDVVNRVHDSNKINSTIPNNPLKDEFCFPEFSLNEWKYDNEDPNHSSFSEQTLHGLYNKNDTKSEKLDLSQVDGDLAQGKPTEPLENVNSKSTFDNCSDISQISYTIGETKSSKKRRRGKRKAKKLQNSTLFSKSSTNSSTSNPIIKSNYGAMKNVKLINSSVYDSNKSLTNSGKIGTELKIPISNNLSNGSFVNIIPNHTTPKKSVQCGTDSAPQNINSTSIEDLTNRIKKLVTSFETVLSQNQQFQSAHKNVCNHNLSYMCDRRINSALPNKDASANIDPDSQANLEYLNSDVPIKESAEKKSSKSNDICIHQTGSEVSIIDCGENANMAHHCATHLRQMHCANMCVRMSQTCTSQIHKCLCCISACTLHSCHHCCKQSLLHCNHSPCTQGLQNQTNMNGPNIVIPLQNISDDGIAQIISALRTRS